jgi:hypothetical protein
MEDKIKYRFDNSTGILYKYYSGTITIQDISSSWDEAISKKIIPENTKGFILDYTKADFDIKLNEVDRIPEYYRQHLDIFGNKKIAIITQTSKGIVVPILVEQKDSGYSSHPFYTLEAAIEWVLS